MVDAVYLPLGKMFLDSAVKFIGAFQVAAERLFDNQPDFFALRQTRTGKPR